MEISNTSRAYSRGHPVVGIIGARQVGKTTLARALADKYAEPVNYFDLEDPADLARLRDPMLALRDLHGLVAIADAQRPPGLFKPHGQRQTPRSPTAGRGYKNSHFCLEERRTTVDTTRRTASQSAAKNRPPCRFSPNTIRSQPPQGWSLFRLPQTKLCDQLLDSGQCRIHKQCCRKRDELDYEIGATITNHAPGSRTQPRHCASVRIRRCYVEKRRHWRIDG